MLNMDYKMNLSTFIRGKFRFRVYGEMENIHLPGYLN